MGSVKKIKTRSGIQAKNSGRRGERRGVKGRRSIVKISSLAICWRVLVVKRASKKVLENEVRIMIDVFLVRSGVMVKRRKIDVFPNLLHGFGCSVAIMKMGRRG